MKLSFSRYLLVALTVFGPTLLLAGPQNDASKDKPEPHTVAPPAGSSAGAAVDSNGYKVESPDILSVRVWHNNDLSSTYAVHPDGKITMPLIGDIEAGGKTPAEIEKNIKEALTKYLKEPIVTVTVQAVLSKKYYMDGEINRPGEYELVGPTTVFEAISKAGGLGPFANGKKIYVLRGDKRIQFNYKEVIRGKNLQQNIALQPGDHVMVP